MTNLDTALYAGPEGLARLWAKLAECRNTVSADFYLDAILSHPDYDPKGDVT